MARSLNKESWNQTGPVATAMASPIEDVERVAKVIRILAVPAALVGCPPVRYL